MNDFESKILSLEKENIFLPKTEIIKSFLENFKLNSQTIEVFQKINFKNLEEKLKITAIKNLYIQTIIDEINKQEIDKNFNYENHIKQKLRKFNIKIKFNYTETGKKSNVNDFILYFTQKLSFYKELIEKIINQNYLCRIDTIRELQKNEKISIIGLLREIYKTKNGYILEIEDRTGVIKCFINNSKLAKEQNLIDLINNLCLDQGLGIEGKVGDSIIWIDKIIDIPEFQEKKIVKTDEENFITAISDIHIGSIDFEDEIFLKFTKLINAQTKSEKINQITKKLKYILIAGDLIEGIGKYPNQENDLIFYSTEMQYNLASKFLKLINEEIGIIISTGNHDSGRLSEPQLPITHKKSHNLYNLKNTIILSNPTNIVLFNKLNINLYHGKSFFYYANNIKKLRNIGGIKKPLEIVKYLFSKRNFAPTHNSVPYIPDALNNTLSIKNLPDIFLCGHTHIFDIENYLGSTLISGGCFSKENSYQKKNGITPNIGIIPLINTKTRKINKITLK